MRERKIVLFRQSFKAEPVWVAFHYSSTERPNTSFLIDNFWMKEKAVNTSSAVHGYSLSILV